MTTYTITHDLGRETDYVAQCAYELPWFRENGYDVPLPAGIDENNLDEKDGVDPVRVAIETELPEKEKILAPLMDDLRRRVTAHQADIDAFFAETFQKLPVPQNIPVFVTTYGPGGSYNVEPPSITTRLDPPTGIDPLANLIHETIHIIIEGPIIQKHSLSHEQKETMVDAICTRAKFLPEYRDQGYGAELPAEWEKLL